MIVDGCCFCEEIITPLNNQFYNEIGYRLGIQDRIVRQNNNLIVVPTIGSLVAGYLLFVTRTHYLSMAELPEETAFSLFHLLDDVMADVHRILNMPCVLFEHGTTSEISNGANSVTHCHIHMAPFAKPIWGKIQKDYMINDSKEFLSVNEAYKYVSTKKPLTYLYFMDVNKKHHIIDENKEFPSQFFRKVIANELNYADMWNWREYAFEDNLQKTLNLLN